MLFAGPAPAAEAALAGVGAGTRWYAGLFVSAAAAAAALAMRLGEDPADERRRLVADDGARAHEGGARAAGSVT